jgi:hypothetical protein
LSEIIQRNPRVWVLFSSHEQLSGSERFEEHLKKVEMVATVPTDELKDFTQAEISYRQAELKNSKNIFRK